MYLHGVGLGPLSKNVAVKSNLFGILAATNGVACLSQQKGFTLGVSPNFEITVVFGLKFHWYLKTISLKFQKARTKIEVLNLGYSNTSETIDFALP